MDEMWREELRVRDVACLAQLIFRSVVTTWNPLSQQTLSELWSAFVTTIFAIS